MKKMKRFLGIVIATVMAITVVPCYDGAVVDAATKSEATITSFDTVAAGTETESGDFDVTYTFHNQSTGTSNWNNYIVELRDSNNKCIDVRADRCGWTWTAADGQIFSYDKNTVMTIKDFAWSSGSSWDTFSKEMQAGVDAIVNIVRVGNVFTITTDNDFCKFQFTVPFEMTDTVTVSLGGESVTLTNIVYTDNNADGKYNMEYYRSDSGKTAPTKSGKIFAGWYTDADYTTPVADDATTGYAYAKFVDAALLTTKCQARAGATAESKSTDLRMMLAVDGLDYTNVGFDVAYNGNTYKGESTTVFKKIVVTDNETQYTYNPSDFFGNSAIYMLSCILTDIPQENFNKTIAVTPYWTTLDGTKVTGATRNVTITDAFQK